MAATVIYSPLIMWHYCYVSAVSLVSGLLGILLLGTTRQCFLLLIRGDLGLGVVRYGHHRYMGCSLTDIAPTNK